MLKKAIQILIIFCIFSSMRVYAQFGDTTHFSTRVVLKDQNGQPLANGSVVQLLFTGTDNTIDPMDENGNPTGDDVLYGTQFAIGDNAVSGSEGYFYAYIDSLTPSGKLYARIFNGSSYATSTYYGQTAPVAKSELPVIGLNEVNFHINKYGLTQTLIPIGTTPTGTPPVADAGAWYNGYEGDSISLSAVNSSDAEETNDTLTFTWDLNGDEVYDDATGIEISYQWNDNSITNTIGVKVTDSDGNSSVDVAQLIITNKPPVLLSVTPDSDSVYKGELFSVNGTYSDAGSADTHTVTIQWGDASETVPVTDGSFSLHHQYTQKGSFSPVIVLKDDDNGQVQTSFELTVTRSPIACAIQKYGASEIKITWTADADESCTVLFLDSSLPGDSYTWQQLSVLPAGIDFCVDAGDADGYNNIAGDNDDRLAPASVLMRFYRVEYTD